MTNDPRSDWCGIKGVGGVSGVADVVLQNIGGEHLVVGEVKLTPEGRGEGIPGESQFLAELKTVQQRQSHQSIVGLLLNPTALHVYLPRSTRKGNFRFEFVKKDVRSFYKVLGGHDFVLGFLVEVGTCIASRPSTPEGGELREESSLLNLWLSLTPPSVSLSLSLLLLVPFIFLTHTCIITGLGRTHVKCAMR